MDKRKKGHGELVIASSDPAKNLEFVEEALNQVAFLISVEITKQAAPSGDAFLIKIKILIRK